MVGFYVYIGTSFCPKIQKYAREFWEACDLKENPSASMSSHITVERVETKHTLIEVAANTHEEAFSEVRNGHGHALGTVRNSELLIRDDPTPKASRQRGAGNCP